MCGIFDVDGSLTKALNGFADIIVMSLWWFIGCIPLITIGASTTALYYAALKSIQQDGSVTKNFWRSFKENWKQATVLEGMFVVLGVVLYVLYGMAYGDPAGSNAVISMVFQVLFFVFLLFGSFVFPILSRFVTNIPMLFRNTLVMSLGDVPRAILIMVLNVLPVLLLFIRIDWFLTALPILIALIPGTIATMNGNMFLKIFCKYVPEEILQQEEECTQNFGTFHIGDE